MLKYIIIIIGTIFYFGRNALSSGHWPYLQVYPPVNKTDTRTPLYFAVALSFGGIYNSLPAIPGIQIALDRINSDPSFLPGYTLHYTLTDSQVRHSLFYTHLLFQLKVLVSGLFMCMRSLLVKGDGFSCNISLCLHANAKESLIE